MRKKRKTRVVRKRTELENTLHIIEQLESVDVRNAGQEQWLAELKQEVRGPASTWEKCT